MDCKHRAIVNGNIRGYGEELFRALQAEIQGLVLFNIFINELGEGAISVLIKLAEETKLGGVSKKTAVGIEIMENDLERDKCREEITR